MAKRAPRGSTKNAIGIYVALDPDLYEAYVKAAAERDITKRELVVGALRRELAEPTVVAQQAGLYDATHIASMRVLGGEETRFDQSA